MIRHKLNFFFKEAMAGFKRSGFMGAATIGVMTIALFALGVFFVVQANFNSLMSGLKEKMEMVAFIKEGVPEPALKALGNLITAQDGVKNVQWVSKEDAFREFSKDQDMKTLLDASGGNPLPASYVITLREEFNDPDRIKGLTRWLQSQPAVEEVSFSQAEIEKLLKLIRLARVIGFTSIVVLVLGAIFMVVTTIRLTVYARRHEVEIMRLAGASAWFVRGPFIMEGLIQGLAAGALAAVLLGIFWSLLMLQVKSQIGVPLGELFPVSSSSLIPLLMLKLLGMGVFLGGVGSLLGVRSFKK